MNFARPPPKFRDATKKEADELWRLALRSKAAWGYDEAFMNACAQELFPSELDQAAVLVESDAIVGFYTLEREDDGTLELGHLFVEPTHFRRGFGKALLTHAAQRARAAGFSVLVIQGDPNARVFYQRCGARYVGERPSASIKGRSLPLFHLDLGPPNATD